MGTLKIHFSVIKISVEHPSQLYRLHRKYNPIVVVLTLFHNWFMYNHSLCGGEDVLFILHAIKNKLLILGDLMN